MARLDQMGEQRSLPALESLQQEGTPQSIKVAIRLGPKRFLEGQSPRESSIDLIRVHMVAEYNADVGYPRQFLDRVAHVVSHQEREICRTPIGRQTKLDVDAIVSVHIGPRDEFELGDRCPAPGRSPFPIAAKLSFGRRSVPHTTGGVDGLARCVSARRLDLLFLRLNVDAIQSTD